MSRNPRTCAQKFPAIAECELRIFSRQCLVKRILRRHELKSTLMTSNRPLEDWGKLIGDVPAATAILNRFRQAAEILEITGHSDRLRGTLPKDREAGQGVGHQDRAY
ncbi:MAG TPA: ATP-binding protein [Planctomycetaceae bacterium]|nr:ATP-binding protein [Planctomycetaceae bacterium]